ncbi:elongation of very long chain fatty acids protein AAEL008004 [Cryptotermes secundus]|uniref:elongation of very long chain fatty acids protein AAEL008004 n=1 Tax=Cryptotermes secundus TaxID=105785 RepID=UPI000CD7DDB7|nr:elongation of very long chain fatty acids protein AAEL008004 [Cryptotermes secundus]
MASIYNMVADVYTTVLHHSDHRSDEWFLMGSPWPVLFIGISYLYFVKSLGPCLMKNRPAFNLDRTIRMYNLVQIILCAFLFKMLYDLEWGRKYRIFCEPLDYTSPRGLHAAKLMYMYFLLKVFDLCDTVFFVLRKKSNQVTFLHVYHHIMMLFTVWAATKFVPGGHGEMVVYVNSFVHVVMYSYYFMTSMWPQYRNNLWWKKYITQLQMIQFVFIGLHAYSALLIKDCIYSRIMATVTGTQSLLVFIMFYNFYRKSYLRRKVM